MWVKVDYLLIFGSREGTYMETETIVKTVFVPMSELMLTNLTMESKANSKEIDVNFERRDEAQELFILPAPRAQGAAHQVWTLSCHSVVISL